jgi:ribosome-associated heat shock protein Hsp15
MTAHEARGVRLDKWLWAARLFKTRSLAAQEIERGRVAVNGQTAKPAREMRAGDLIQLRRQGWQQEIEVLGLSGVRGPAPVARLLYRETPQSLEAAQQWAQARRLGIEPALGQEQGRPTKRDRRQLADWQRWSASLDED